MKTSKKHNSNRSLRIESLEERELLSVTAGDFAAIKSQYADLGLTNYDDYNIIEVAADQLSETALRNAMDDVKSIAQNPNTILDDYLVVLRTIAT